MKWVGVWTQIPLDRRLELLLGCRYCDFFFFFKHKWDATNCSQIQGVVWGWADCEWTWVWWAAWVSVCRGRCGWTAPLQSPPERKHNQCPACRRCPAGAPDPALSQGHHPAGETNVTIMSSPISLRAHPCIFTKYCKQVGYQKYFNQQDKNKISLFTVFILQWQKEEKRHTSPTKFSYSIFNPTI